MKKEFDTFVNKLDDLREGVEIEMMIRDLTPGLRKYEGRYVKAIVSRSPEKMNEGDVLWIRFQRGMLHPSPWAIKIIKELGELMPSEAVGIMA